MNKKREKILKKILFCSLIFFTVFCSLGNVNAQVTETRVFKIYISPALIENLSFAKTTLVKYVQDMNYILAKNTNKQLSFDPETGIILTYQRPDTGTVLNSRINESYEIWAAVNISDSRYNYSYGGFGSINGSGDSVLAGLRWKKIYDPDALLRNTPEMRDYWVQINNMLHEFAHIYQAGYGEYYNLVSIKDTTGVNPILDINLDNPADSYWSYKTDYFADPLTRNAYGKTNIGNPTDRRALLETVKYCNLTAAMIREGKRFSSYPFFYLPDLHNIKITVLDKKTLQPIPDSQVKIWNIRGTPQHESFLLYNNKTDNYGEFIFYWGVEDPRGNFDFLKLIKVYKEGYFPLARYISAFDAEEAKILHNQSEFVIRLFMNPENTNNILIAEAGSDQVIIDKNNDGFESVLLNGSLSYYSEDIISYEWSEKNLVIGDGITLLKNFTVGNHTILLKIKDSLGREVNDSLSIDIKKNVSSEDNCEKGYVNEFKCINKKIYQRYNNKLSYKNECLFKWKSLEKFKTKELCNEALINPEKYLNNKLTGKAIADLDTDAISNILRFFSKLF